MVRFVPLFLAGGCFVITDREVTAHDRALVVGANLGPGAPVAPPPELAPAPTTGTSATTPAAASTGDTGPAPSAVDGAWSGTCATAEATDDQVESFSLALDVAEVDGALDGTGLAVVVLALPVDTGDTGASELTFEVPLSVQGTFDGVAADLLLERTADGVAVGSLWGPIAGDRWDAQLVDWTVDADGILYACALAR